MLKRYGLTRLPLEWKITDWHQIMEVATVRLDRSYDYDSRTVLNKAMNNFVAKTKGRKDEPGILRSERWPLKIHYYASRTRARVRIPYLEINAM